MREVTYEQSICYGFMKIMRYICQQNSSGESTSKQPYYISDQALALISYFIYSVRSSSSANEIDSRLIIIPIGDYLGMSLPIVTMVRTNENHSVISQDVTVAYYLPADHQAQPPQAIDSEIVIEIWPATIVYTRYVEDKELGSPGVLLGIEKEIRLLISFLLLSSRAFTGPTNEVTIINEINILAELLDCPAECVNDKFIVAGYTNPAHSNRQNEIWFLELS